jgi:hypothetical protein
MPTIYELSIGLDTLEERKTSIPTSNQNTIFPSCSSYSLVTTLTKSTIHLAKQLPMTQVVSYLKTYFQKFIMSEQTVIARWGLFHDHL